MIYLILLLPNAIIIIIVNVCLCVLQSIYALVYAIFVTSCLCYLLLTWANLHLSSAIVTAFWPLQVHVLSLLDYARKLDMYYTTVMELPESYSQH